MNKNESKENYELSQKQRGEFCFFFSKRKCERTEYVETSIQY